MTRPHRSTPAPNGFTLTELLVVLAIIGLLTTIVVINVLPQRDKATAAKARADIATLEQALELWRIDTGRYPTTDEGLTVLTTAAASAGPTLKRLPNDPWGRPYRYASPGVHGEADVWTLGSEGGSGGTGTAADIGNWEAKS
jgi:general secretion pathway protein G